MMIESNKFFFFLKILIKETKNDWKLLKPQELTYTFLWFDILWVATLFFIVMRQIFISAYTYRYAKAFLSTNILFLLYFRNEACLTVP